MTFLPAFPYSLCFLVLFKRTFGDRNIYIFIVMSLGMFVFVNSLYGYVLDGIMEVATHSFLRNVLAVLRICVVGLEKGSELCRLLSKVGRCK
jgi:hypothetical protein